MHRLLTTRRMQNVAIGLFGCIAIILAVQMYRSAYRPCGYDFTSYLKSARALIEGGDPYHAHEHFPYVYPLFLAFVLIPFALLPYWMSNLLWLGMSIASLLVSCLALLRIAGTEIKTSQGRHVLVSGLLALIVIGGPVQNNMGNGQVNLIVVACCVMFLYHLTREQRLLGGVWLAAAISLKLLPAIFLMFLVFRKEWRVALYAVGFTILFCLLPFVVVGTTVFDFYASYIDSFLLAKLGGHGESGSGNLIFSLEGTVRYLLPSLGQGRWLRILNTSGTLGGLVWLEVLALRSARPGRDIWPFCGYLIAALMLSPMAEAHHLTLMVPAVFLVTHKIIYDREWLSRGITALFVSFVIVFMVVAKALKHSPIYFVSLVMMFVLLGLALDRRNGDAEGASAEDEAASRDEATAPSVDVAG